MEKKINCTYSNNIMNHNNAEYVKEIIYECILISIKFSNCKHFY